MSENMQIEKRYMERCGWSRIIESDFSHRFIDTDEFVGAVGLLHLKRVKNPLDIIYGIKTVRIVDNDYYWLQLAPQNKNWWLTVMFDDNKELVQFYFDITLENVLLPNGKSYFNDLFLDVVFLPKGQNFLLDEDELNQAIDEGVINKKQYELAKNTADHIIRAFPLRVKQIEKFCNNIFDKILEV